MLRLMLNLLDPLRFCRILGADAERANAKGMHGRSSKTDAARGFTSRGSLPARLVIPCGLL